MSLTDKIKEAKEIIGDEAALKIAEYYHIENFDEDKLKGCCPFHKEDTPSFIWNKKDKYFKCFGCNRKIGILDLYIEQEGTFSKALKRLFSETKIDFDLKEFRQSKEEHFENYRYPKEETNTDRTKVEEYAAKRGISKETLDYAGVKQDVHGNCVFELRDLDDVLVGVKYRPSYAVSRGMPKMWWQKDADTCPSLFNISKIDVSKPLVITEGYFDTLAVIEAGYRNVVSIPGGAGDFNWIEFNYDFLQNVEQFILWFDNDRPGIDGREHVQQRLGEYRCKIVKPTQGDLESIKEYYAKYNIDCQKADANNVLVACGKERVMGLIDEAEEIPSKKLKFLMDCKVENIKDLEKTSMGIEALDSILYGNLFPCFTIYSGRPGSGKSSLANVTSLISPIENGYKTFVFSGELSEGQLADWVVSPLAGYNHIQEIVSKESSDRPFYVVTKEAREAIQSYYRKDILIYSDENELDTSGDSLLNAMEEAYKRYGCRVFEVDNLMCLSFENSDEESKWDSQKKFIIRLMNFTEKYKVCVNLILHPRKMDTTSSRNPSTYDLHGASEIGNLCHRLLWVDRLDPQQEMYNTKITVVKDRPTQAAGRHCELYYDEMTRRFYSSNEELRKTYSWENKSDIQYPSNVESVLIKNKPIEPLPHESSNYDLPM